MLPAITVSPTSLKTGQRSTGSRGFVDSGRPVLDRSVHRKAFTRADQDPVCRLDSLYGNRFDPVAGNPLRIA